MVSHIFQAPTDAYPSAHGAGSRHCAWPTTRLACRTMPLPCRAVVHHPASPAASRVHLLQRQDCDLNHDLRQQTRSPESGWLRTSRLQWGLSCARFGARFRHPSRDDRDQGPCRRSARNHSGVRPTHARKTRKALRACGSTGAQQARETLRLGPVAMVAMVAMVGMAGSWPGKL